MYPHPDYGLNDFVEPSYGPMARKEGRTRGGYRAVIFSKSIQAELELGFREGIVFLNVGMLFAFHLGT